MQKIKIIPQNKSEKQSDLKKEFEKLKRVGVPFKSVLIGLSVAKKNKKFETLSPCEQTREIALDALSLLMKQNVQAFHGYWEEEMQARAVKAIKNINNNIQNEFQNEGDCHVCQRGLWMLSQARTCGVDIVKTNLYFENESRIDKMAFMAGSNESVKGLSFKMLEQMENEYELSKYSNNYEFHTKNKLANVICNILQNCGYDKNDITDYLKLWNIDLSPVTDFENEKEIGDDYGPRFGGNNYCDE